jgi:Predicted membrane protein (DUF2306)
MTTMNARTKFVVFGMALLYVVSWYMSLASLFGIHFWDKKYALHRFGEHPQDHIVGDSDALAKIGKSYYSSSRYFFFLPHVLGAIVWWNLYFLQLIPKIRHMYKQFHRSLGRCLMVAAFLQAASGVGLAWTSHSNVIKLISYSLAIAVFFCIFHAWHCAYYRDIPKHKYWVVRLVGYMQTIALQRFWFFFLIVTHSMGWQGLYPTSGNDATLEEENRIVLQIFDDSFILALLTAIFVTEWYLAGEQGMLEKPQSTIMPSAAEMELRSEERPLLEQGPT